MSPKVSVIVPTFRRPELLADCLDQLLAQTLAESEYEVIVADDEASPRTERLVADKASRTPVTLRYVPVRGRHGPAAARNAGVSASSIDSELLAFTDDDCLPDDDWLRAALECFERGTAAHRPLCASGRLVMPLPKEPTDYERDAARLSEAGFVTANAFVQKDAFLAIGGFDERFTSAWREDSDLFFRLLKLSHTRGVREPYVWIQDAVVVHPIRPASWGVSLRQQKKAFFNALLYKKHPDLYRERIQARPPLSYYAVLAALLVALAGISLGQPALLTGGVVGWSLLTAWFFARRLQGTTKAMGHVTELALTSALIPPLAVYWRLRGAATHRVVFL
jgi:glycosyltransferase involved in cell wall biosynthesis